MTTEREWTADEVAKLRRMLADKVSEADIALWLERTINSVNRKRHRLGLIEPKPAPILPLPPHPGEASRRIPTLAELVPLKSLGQVVD